MQANTTGHRNIGIGRGAGALLTTGNDNINIGHPGVAGESNTIRLGNSQSVTYVAGIASSTGVTGSNVVVDANGRLGVGKISQMLRLAAVTSPPASCSLTEKGSVYVDDDSNELCFCDGTSWTGLKAGGACN